MSWDKLSKPIQDEILQRNTLQGQLKQTYAIHDYFRLAMNQNAKQNQSQPSEGLNQEPNTNSSYSSPQEAFYQANKDENLPLSLLRTFPEVLGELTEMERSMLFDSPLIKKLCSQGADLKGRFRRIHSGQEDDNGEYDHLQCTGINLSTTLRNAILEEIRSLHPTLYTKQEEIERRKKNFF